MKLYTKQLGLQNNEINSVIIQFFLNIIVYWFLMLTIKSIMEN